MDPDCAICHSAASLRCDCEAKALETAINHAENQMMRSMYQEIREWARGHAQDYILSYFSVLSERRKEAHSRHLEELRRRAYYYNHSEPHPSEIAHAQQVLKRGIDEDWQTSVQRYPEVLEYFFSLVELSLPREDEPAVKDPPLSALNGSRKAGRRPPPPPPEAIAPGPYHSPLEPLPPRNTITPPPPPPTQGMGRRTPGPAPRAERRSLRPPPPASSFYAGHGPHW
ncbi:hypothetical protein VUR80DRAFT_3343 [Thermomyces stellatus]